MRHQGLQSRLHAEQNPQSECERLHHRADNQGLSVFQAEGQTGANQTDETCLSGTLKRKTKTQKEVKVAV